MGLRLGRGTSEVIRVTSYSAAPQLRAGRLVQVRTFADWLGDL